VQLRFLQPFFHSSFIGYRLQISRILYSWSLACIRLDQSPAIPARRTMATTFPGHPLKQCHATANTVPSALPLAPSTTQTTPSWTTLTTPMRTTTSEVRPLPCLRQRDLTTLRRVEGPHIHPSADPMSRQRTDRGDTPSAESST
jgi:hypothetical protein